MGQGWMRRQSVIAIFILAHMWPINVWPTTTSFGTARGTRGVEVTLNGGKTWVSLGGRALPLVQDIVIRSRIGHAWIELADGSRLTVLPSDIVQLRRSDPCAERRGELPGGYPCRYTHTRARSWR